MSFDAPESRAEAALQNMLGAGNVLEPPQSREEAILQNMLGANNALEPPQSRVEDLLQQLLESGGGGNPNRVETITGTLAEPFGEHSVAELLSKVGSDVSVKLELSFGGMTGSVLLDSNGTYLYGGYAAFSVSGGQGTITTAFRLDYAENGLHVADAYMSGTYMDLVPMASQIPTETTIIWHPLKEAEK